MEDWKIFQNFSKDKQKTDINEIMEWCLKHAAGEWERTLRVYDQMDDGFHNDSVDPDKVAEITIQILRQVFQECNHHFSLSLLILRI